MPRSFRRRSRSLPGSDVAYPSLLHDTHTAGACPGHSLRLAPSVDYTDISHARVRGTWVAPFSALAHTVVAPPLRSCDDLENGCSVDFLDHPQPPITWMGVEKPSLCVQPSPDNGRVDRKDAGQLDERHETLHLERRAHATNHHQDLPRKRKTRHDSRRFSCSSSH